MLKRYIYFCILPFGNLLALLCILLSEIIVINIWAEHFFYEAIFGNIFFVEGGIPFILLGILLYLFRNKVKFTIAYSSFSLFIYATYTKWGSGMNPIINYLVPYGSYQWMIAALPLLLLFNGKKGPRLKYFFYLFYPIHIIILYFIGISLR
ncbi:TraX family protein [Siminovitchia sp. 179-K 8D1 HS]|uniref:TraX family protein n=1 Tax=Siminovitchia sp. 179-K 8D1 HS TaxID=3142385 RepID=UPI0039A37D50